MCSFYKDHFEKETATFKTINIVLSMAKLTIKLIVKQMALKQK